MIGLPLFSNGRRPEKMREQRKAHYKGFSAGCGCDIPCAVSDNGEYSCVSQTIYVHLMRTPRMQVF